MYKVFKMEIICKSIYPLPAVHCLHILKYIFLNLKIVKSKYLEYDKV